MIDNSKIKSLIVDDEPLARERIREMLKVDPEIEIVGECGNGQGAVKAVQENPPDLIFLDVQMPEMDGFAVMEAINKYANPIVIFVTAFDQYAVQAFEVYALDYLLKPFDRERFEKALQRAKSQIQREKSKDMNQKIFAMLEELKGKPAYIERVVIKSEGHVFFLRTDDIDWVEAEGNYVCLHTGKKTHLLRETITTLESELDPKKFLRIHRSTIVNIDRIQELHSWFHGDYRVVLQDGTQLTLSRNYRDRLRDVLGKQL
jgi:two-component system, LytTR family, response regulator